MKIDNDFYEIVIAYNVLTDVSYLSSVIDYIQPQYFKDGNIRSIVNVIIDYYKKRDEVPTLTEIKGYLTTPELKDNFKAVIILFTDFDQKFNKDELYENTERFLKEKAVYHTLLDVADHATDEDLDTNIVLEKFEKSCNVNLATDIGLDYFDDIDIHIKDLITVDNTISSKWEWLDRKLGGGFLENGRAIYVFAGETNIGKSIFLGNVAKNISEQGKTVLLISLEMSELVYAKRLTTNLTQIPINDLHNRTDDIKAVVEQYKRNHNNSRVLVKEFPPNTITCSHLKGYIKKIIDKGIKIDTIVIDYVNLLRSTVGNNSYERIKDVTEQLRALTYTFDCPIITATQLNRQGYNEINPSLDTIGESIGLAATADCIFSIWQEEEDAELGIIKLGIMKNRFGENYGGISMRIDYNTLTLSEDNTFSEDRDINTAMSTLDFLSDTES
ncbi:hypothetical protein CL622_02135 [archaeon]|nr:hypothetical protein [archaeon]